MTEPLKIDVDRNAWLQAEAQARLAGDPTLAPRLMRDGQRHHIASHLLSVANHRMGLEDAFPGRSVREYQAMHDALKWQALMLYPLYGEDVAKPVSPSSQQSDPEALDPLQHTRP